MNRGEAQSGLAQQSPKLPSVGSNPTTPAISDDEKIKEVLVALDRPSFEEILENFWRTYKASTDNVIVAAMKEAAKDILKKAGTKKKSIANAVADNSVRFGPTHIQRGVK
jgi:hypothetical protein